MIRLAAQFTLGTRDGRKVLATINERLEYPGFSEWSDFKSVWQVHVSDGPVYRLQPLTRQSRKDASFADVDSGGTVLRVMEHLRRQFRREALFVEAHSGAAVLRVIGQHFDHGANGSVQVLSQPGAMESGTHAWRFPVQATKPQNAVMTAVDDSGNTTMHFRRTPSVKNKGFWEKSKGFLGQIDHR